MSVSNYLAPNAPEPEIVFREAKFPEKDRQRVIEAAKKRYHAWAGQCKLGKLLCWN
jgi:hypothetical protein